MKPSLFEDMARTGKSYLKPPISAKGLQAIAVVTLSFLAGTLVFLLYPADPSWHLQIQREHFAQFNMEYTKPQRMGHLTLLACLALGGVLSCLFKAKEELQTISAFVFKIISTLLISGLLITLIGMHSRGYYGLIVFTFACVLSFRNQNIWIIWSLIGALCVLAIVPGLIGTPVPTFDFSAIDTHFANMLSHGERLAAGHLLFIDNTPNYGTLIPILTAIIAKISGAMSFGELVRFIQFWQTSCFVIVLLTVWHLTSGAPSAKRALAILLVTLPATLWFSNVFLFIWFPNQTGVRFFALFFSILVVALCQNLQAKPFGAIIGLTAMLALSWNLETGITITAGLGMAWLVIVRRQTKAIAFGSALVGLAAFLGLFAAIALIYHGVFGGWPWPPSLEETLRRIFLFSGGHAGIKFRFNPTAIVIVLHTGYVFVRLIQYLLKPDEEIVTPINAMIATTLLTWMAWYFNRSEDLYLWVFIILYALMLAPLIARRDRQFFALALVGIMIVSFAWSASPNLIKKVRKQTNWVLGWKTGCADGVILDQMICEKLAERAAALKKLASEGSIYWSTGFPFLTMRMTGQYGALPMIDSYAFATTQAREIELLKTIRSMNPKMIVVDDPDDRVLKFDPNFIKFHTRLTAKFSKHYCVEKRIGGWKVIMQAAHCPRR